MEVNKEKATEAQQKMLQRVVIKHLKEKYDIGDKDELQQNTAARTPMKKMWCV